MTFYPPPRFPSQSSQRDRSRPSSSDSELIIGLYRTRRKASNGSGKSWPGPAKTGLASSAGGTSSPQFGSTPRWRQNRATTPPGGVEVIEEPQVGRFVDRHFRPLKSHQRRRPCSRYRIAQGIEDTKIWQQSRDFSNCSLIQCGVGRRDFALLSPLKIIGKQTGPPLNPVAAAAIPEMDFLTRRKPYMGMPGKVLVDPGCTGFLCTDPEKVYHISFASQEALDVHVNARARSRPRYSHAMNRPALAVGGPKWVDVVSCFTTAEKSWNASS